MIDGSTFFPKHDLKTNICTTDHKLSGADLGILERGFVLLIMSGCRSNYIHKKSKLIVVTTLSRLPLHECATDIIQTYLDSCKKNQKKTDKIKQKKKKLLNIMYLYTYT